MLTSMAEEDAEMVKRINLLFDIIVEVQEKAFGLIVKQALKKD